jgi:superfamily II DNA or RNA helicase
MSLSIPSLSFSGGTLLIEGLPRAEAQRQLAPLAAAQVAHAWDDRVRAWRCDAGDYAAIRDRFAAAGLRCDDRFAAWRPVRWPRLSLPPLRAEQQAALDAWLKAPRGLVVMPTGTGKTEVALAIMARAATATLVVAPVRDLMYQWQRRILAGLGYDPGIIGDGVYRARPVSVTTYDSACIHMQRLGDQFGLIVFDECHHLTGAIRRDAARMCGAPMRLGLTATPWGQDERQAELERLIGPTVYQMQLTAAKGGALADFDVVKIPVHLSPDEQARYDRCARQVREYVAERRKSEPDFAWGDLCAETARTPEARRVMQAFHAKKSIEDRAEEKLRVLEDLFRLHAGDKCLVFAGSNAMARDVSRRFLIPCLLSHCRKRERQEVLTGLEQGTYPALVANQVLDEGVDLPAVKVAIVIGGTASSRQAQQRLGRILRKQGQARATLYEIVCADTGEVDRSRQRRKSDAYQGTRHRRR